MGYETRLNRVEDPAVPCHKVCKMGDFEPYLVCGGENGMQVCEYEGVQRCGLAVELVRSWPKARGKETDLEPRNHLSSPSRSERAVTAFLYSA